MTRRSIREFTLIKIPIIAALALSLIELGRLAAVPEPGLPVVELAIVTYWRGPGESPVARELGTLAFLFSRSRSAEGGTPQFIPSCAASLLVISRTFLNRAM